MLNARRNRGYVIATAAMLGVAVPGCQRDEVVEVVQPAPTSGGQVVVVQPQPQPTVVAQPTYAAPVQTQPYTGSRMGGGYVAPPPPSGRMGGSRM